ncbi:MAG TPA: GNAT family N-acetyltransferase [Solirubrobacteraceae bacterium]|nr:GNAT family N-acetyltransferase [Solirubrobacteraceae bacterium]
MPEVRELPAGETARAARALLELRPHLRTPAALAERVDAVQRPEGYRLIGAFEGSDEDASAAAGFRVVEMLAWGRALYVDDLVTLPERRGRGHADALFAWLDEEAARLGCDQLHLDSGVGPERADAHRFYFRHGLRITSYHFARGARRA